MNHRTRENPVRMRAARHLVIQTGAHTYENFRQFFVPIDVISSSNICSITSLILHSHLRGYASGLPRPRAIARSLLQSCVLRFVHFESQWTFRACVPPRACTPPVLAPRRLATVSISCIFQRLGRLMYVLESFPRVADDTVNPCILSCTLLYVSKAPSNL
jgi:hypothetical protein